MHIRFEYVVVQRHIEMSKDREFITQFLDLYRTLPCLWDVSCAEYKDKDRKNQAWQLLADVLQYIEPTADVNTAKTRIKHMRTAYQRESRKVRISIQRGATGSQVHVPYLWYYKLLTFLDGKDDQCTGAETVASDDESRTSIEKNERVSDETLKKKARHDHNVDKINEKIIEPENKLLPQPKAESSKSFANYVSEQLDQMDTFQRDVAEKLISEVVFLAKTRKLTLDSKIQTSSRSFKYPSSSSSPQSSYSPPNLFQSGSQDGSMDPPTAQFILACSKSQDSLPPNGRNNDFIRPFHDYLPAQINQASHTTQLQVKASLPATTKLNVISAASQMERNDTEYPETSPGFASLLKEHLLKSD